MSITWHGVSSNSVGIRVEHYPNLNIPKRRYSLVDVAGRNGAVIVPDDSFENVELKYDIYLPRTSNMMEQARQVTAWLFAPTTRIDYYGALIDSYDSGITRRAVFTGGQEIESILNRLGKATITFSAWPQRYIGSSLNTTDITVSGTTLTNPTPNLARPIISVRGSGSGTVTVGNNTISLSSLPVIIDSELYRAYYGTVNKASTMTGDYPTIAGNEEVGIEFSGGVTGLGFAPRWYWL